MHTEQIFFPADCQETPNLLSARLDCLPNKQFPIRNVPEIRSIEVESSKITFFIFLNNPFRKKNLPFTKIFKNTKVRREIGPYFVVFQVNHPPKQYSKYPNKHTDQVRQKCL